MIAFLILKSEVRAFLSSISVSSLDDLDKFPYFIQHDDDLLASFGVDFALWIVVSGEFLHVDVRGLEQARFLLLLVHFSLLFASAW